MRFRRLNRFLRKRCMAVGRMDICELLRRSNPALDVLIEEIIAVSGPEGEDMDVQRLMLCMDIIDIREPVHLDMEAARHSFIAFMREKGYEDVAENLAALGPPEQRTNLVIAALSDERIDYDALAAQIERLRPKAGIIRRKRRFPGESGSGIFH